MKMMISTAIAMIAASSALAQGDCAAGRTMEEGKLTVATGNPAYFPWVIDDAPESQQGFEAAVAYAVAREMGFADDQVVWVRSSFDQAIQPGAKDFDFNLQQFSITPERDEIVDFSAPYYSAAMAVLTRQPVVDGGATPTVAALKGLKWGADANTTAVPMLTEIIGPDSDPLLYGDNADVVEAMKANQIDAALFDLTTALYLGAVVMDDGAICASHGTIRTHLQRHHWVVLQQCADHASRVALSCKHTSLVQIG